MSSLTIAEIAQHVKIQPRTLERLFKMNLQLAPKEYYLKLRLTYAQNLLKQSTLNISNIALACGFCNVSSFTKAYKAFFNYSPNLNVTFWILLISVFFSLVGF